MPASNNKIYTCAAAIHYLGKGYQFETNIVHNSNNLYIIGGGDPDQQLWILIHSQNNKK